MKGHFRSAASVDYERQAPPTRFAVTDGNDDDVLYDAELVGAKLC